MLIASSNNLSQASKKLLLGSIAMGLPSGGYFGRLVEVSQPKLPLVHGQKPSFEARPARSIPHSLQYI
jgi:hypothetical protein